MLNSAVLESTSSIVGKLKGTWEGIMNIKVGVVECQDEIKLWGVW